LKLQQSNSEITEEQLHGASREQLMALVRGQEKLIRGQEQLVRSQEELIKGQQKETDRLKAYISELEERLLRVGEQLVLIKNKLYGKSSERRLRTNSDSGSSNGQKTKKAKTQLPSQRYPNAPLIEREIMLKELPDCRCCGTQMEDSGMTEDAEFLTAIPRQYFVVRQKRHKYRCGKCHGDIQTAPAPPRIKEGSSYSDEMIIDVALTKYCDLVPIERYTKMAGREGLENLPQQSLIESTHYLAEFVTPAYDQLKAEISASKVLHADETPHRMLEGDKKSKWFLWGFSNSQTSYFECRDTRSGDVASVLLIPTQCEYLVSDVFSGYIKAVRESNEKRALTKKPLISHVYCNAHARRRFKEAQERDPEGSKFFVEKYSEIYQLECEAKGKPPDIVLELRSRMIPLFEAIRAHAQICIEDHSSKSGMGRAASYFLGNYDGLTRFVTQAELPIDNNPAERLLRNPVIGRKTWYGTHSKQGAKTAAILFSLVESAKLNQLNPREYFRKLVQAIHEGRPAFTPKKYSEMIQANG